MNKRFLLVPVMAGLLAFSAQTALAQNIAIVNGKAVPKARLDALAEQVAKAGRPVTPEMQGQLREEVVTREIFMQEAEKRNLAATDEFKVQMELARQTIMIRGLFADFQKTNPVTEAELRADYDSKVKASGGKEFKTRHILVEKESEAVAIIASLKKGGKFDEIAKKQSKDTGSGAKGGDLDWGNPGDYVPEFSEALLKLNKGQTTEAPVKTQFGYHVIRVDDIRTVQLPAFDDVKPQISQQMTQQKLAAFQDELRKKAKIE